MSGGHDTPGGVELAELGEDQQLDWREQLFRRRYLGVRLDLGPTRQVLDALLPGLLERPPFRVVQVVGTNGKGSTAAMLEHGLRGRVSGPVGLFTSPHLERVGERIRVDGVALDDAHIRAGVAKVGEIERQLGVELSFFEVLTALALEHFVARACSHVVLEAGLGARLDATTAVPTDCVAIARVALDHQAYLGDSLVAIAGEKAAAIRSSAPVFSVAQAPEVTQVLRRRASEHQAPLTMVEPCTRAPRRLPGAHQRHNAALALALLAALDVPASIEDLDEVAWPGRLERLALSGGELWLDVAHNLDGIEALVEALAQLELRPDAIVFGAMRDKAGPAMARALAALAPLWLVPPVPGSSFDPSELEDLAELAGAARYEGPADPRLHGALDGALAAGRRVLVCGSHVLVGQLRSRMLERDADDPRLSDPLTRT